MMKTGVEEEEQYATAVEVNGIRRTLDSFMKEQDVHNSQWPQIWTRLWCT